MAPASAMMSAIIVSREKFPGISSGGVESMIFAAMVRGGVVEQHGLGFDSDARSVFADDRGRIRVVGRHGGSVQTGQRQLPALPEVVPEPGQEHADASSEFADGLA